MIRSHLLMTALAASLTAAGARAETLALPLNGDSLVGALGVTSTRYEDTIPDIAYLYGMGFYDMKLANPGVDSWIPGEGTELIVPSKYVLPETPREGIIVNVPEMRLYYYPKTKAGEPPVVHTYPIGVGREDWVTPHTVTKITQKTKDPAWYPPESIRREHAADGRPLPTVVKPGPDNPLGQYAMRLGLQSYLIHGTNNPYGIGMRVTHGCIRLSPKDIEHLFHITPVGTPVRIVNQPVKVGLENGIIYVEAHPHFVEDKKTAEDHYLPVVQSIARLAASGNATLDWNRLREVVVNPTGIPTMVGRVAPATPMAER